MVLLLLQLKLTAPVFSVCLGVLPLAPSNALREVAVRKKELLSSSKIKLVEWSAPLTRNENLVGEESGSSAEPQPVDLSFFALALQKK